MVLLTTSHFQQSEISWCIMLPVGTQDKNDAVLTSMRRDDVASTSIRRHFDTICSLGFFHGEMCCGSHNVELIVSILLDKFSSGE